jgi:hypothetical protein
MDLPNIRVSWRRIDEHNNSGRTLHNGRLNKGARLGLPTGAEHNNGLES